MLPIHTRAAGILALCFGACRSAAPDGGDPPTDDPSARAARAGALIRTAHYQMRASLPEECAPNDHAPGRTATHRIGIALSLEPTTDVQVPANPYYARLVDADRNVYEATLGGCGAPLSPALPARGEMAKGWVVFELPRSARPATLLYAPELVGGAKTELAIELQR